MEALRDSQPQLHVDLDIGAAQTGQVVRWSRDPQGPTSQLRRPGHAREPVRDELMRGQESISVIVSKVVPSAWSTASASFFNAIGNAGAV